MKPVTSQKRYKVEQIQGGTRKRIQLADLKRYETNINGALKKALQYSELSEYGPLIYDTITSYNNGINKTMMIKGPRKQFDKTTNRESHQKNLEYIATTIAKNLGLNTEFVSIMARNHDIGHTFLGHSGEWWISNVKEDLGLGYYCHNALGPRDLLYRKRIYEEILNNIKEENPEISPQKLKRIKNSLWLILEGINSHNGEKSEYQYVADANKKEEDFLEEMLYCHTIKGFDRKIVPATPEAALMRLCDKISYIPYDMIDGIREGFIAGLDNEYTVVLKELGITEKEIENCKKSGDYEPIAKKLQNILIQDVIEASKKGLRKISSEKGRPIAKTELVIRMSPEKANLMHRLRDINNKQIVDYVVLQEDSDVYVPAIGTLMEEFKTFILKNGLEDKLATGFDSKTKEELQERFANTKYSKFVDFISFFTTEEYAYIQKMLKAAREQAANDELSIARDVVLNRKNVNQIVNPDMFPNKNYRIQKFINYYNKTGLREEIVKEAPNKAGKKVSYITVNGNEQKYTDDINKKFVKKIKNGNDYISSKEGFAYEVGARYLSTLDDEQFLQTLLDFGIINQEKLASLTKKYNEFGVEELRKRVYRDPNWKKVEKAQKKATQEAMQQK